MKRYFIIWYISPDKTYEEEVSVNKYAEALLEEIENNQNPLCIPYSTYVRYYFRMKNMDKFEEIHVNAPKVYDELYSILYPEKFKYENEIVRHRIKHIDDTVNELITNAGTISNSATRRNAIDPYIEIEIYDFIHRSLSKEHAKIFLKYFFEDIPQEKIARLENVNQSTISRYLRESINKLKKEFFKKS
jgi:RNA polymerase sigma factor (sigma-70 family)